MLGNSQTLIDIRQITLKTLKSCSFDLSFHSPPTSLEVLRQRQYRRLQLNARTYRRCADIHSRFLIMPLIPIMKHDSVNDFMILIKLQGNLETKFSYFLNRPFLLCTFLKYYSIYNYYFPLQKVLVEQLKRNLQFKWSHSWISRFIT